MGISRTPGARRGPRGLAVVSALLAIGACLGPERAGAQQTGASVPPSDMAAIERELQSVLDYGAPDETVRFPVPSGGRATIRPDLPIDRYSGSQCVGCADPCRAYQITVETPDRTREVVMEGFRCRQSASGLWVMRQPERIVAERPILPEAPDEGDAEGVGGPLVLGRDGAGPVGRAGEDPRLAADPGARDRDAADAGAPARPEDFRRELEGVLGESGDLRWEGETDVAAGDEAVAEDETGLADLPADLAAAAGASGDAAAGPEEATDDASATATLAPGTIPPRPRAAPDAGERTLASLPADERARRVIYPGPGDVADGEDGVLDDLGAFASDPEIVRALRRLYYLPDADAGATPDEAAVTRAIEAFARDERFAIPVEHAALVVYLRSAIERIEDVDTCEAAAAEDGPFAACIAPEPVDS